VVVVLPGTDELGLVVPLGGGLEAELVDVEVAGGGQVADAEVDVPDGRGPLGGLP
jgi:hypothetical protein